MSLITNYGITASSGGKLKITGQEIISGEYQETIAKFDTVAFGNVIENPDVKILLDFLPPSSNNSDNRVDFSLVNNYLGRAGVFINEGIQVFKQVGDIFIDLNVSTPSNTGSLQGFSFSPDSNYFAVTTQQPPHLLVYVRNNDSFTKLSDLPGLDGQFGRGCRFSNTGAYLIAGLSSSPSNSLHIYKKGSGNTFTKLPNPAQLPSGSVYDIAFSPDDTYLATVGDNNPYVNIYKRDGDTFTKLANPVGALPTSQSRGVHFSPNGTYLAVVQTNSPYLFIYKRDGDTFTKLANPDILPTGSSFGVTFSPDNVYLSVLHGGFPHWTLYKRDGDTFTKLPNQAILPQSTGWDSAFSPDGKYLAITSGSTTSLTIYKNSATEGIIKANNAILTNAFDLGYALEDGTAGQTKTMMSLFRK